MEAFQRLHRRGVSIQIWKIYGNTSAGIIKKEIKYTDSVNKLEFIKIAYIYIKLGI